MIKLADKITIEIDRRLHPEHYASFDGAYRQGQDLRIKGEVPRYRSYCGGTPLIAEQCLSVLLRLLVEIKTAEIEIMKAAKEAAETLKAERDRDALCSNS